MAKVRREPTEQRKAITDYDARMVRYGEMRLEEREGSEEKEEWGGVGGGGVGEVQHEAIWAHQLQSVMPVGGRLQFCHAIPTLKQSQHKQSALLFFSILHSKGSR